VADPGSRPQSIEAERDLDAFMQEQAALRRVATIAAHGAEPIEVFRAVVNEVMLLLDLPVVALTRYEPDGMVLMVASGGDHPFKEGTRWPVDGLPVAAEVLETRQTAYMETYVTEHPVTEGPIREGRVRSGLAVPIIVDNSVWGTISTASTDRPLRPDTEERLIGFTELVAGVVLNAQARDELRRLAEEQAALRRVATLVAEGAAAPVIYDAICTETRAVTGANSVHLLEFLHDGTGRILAVAGEHASHTSASARLPVDETSLGMLRDLVAAARIDGDGEAATALAKSLRERGVSADLAVSVVVDGTDWGALVADWHADGGPPVDVSHRLSRFADLVATAVANAAAHSELIASRLRIVNAADEARRRVERDLHDGAQQRLVALSLDLDRIGASFVEDQPDARSDLEVVRRELDGVLEDLRELSRGLHPAILSESGLGPSLRALARRSPIPAEVDVDVPARPAPAIEVAVYYVVSEALANVAKHARASAVGISVHATEGWIHTTIKDDGVGGARHGTGSGLVGLMDRVVALGGRLELDSPPGGGTRLEVDLPTQVPDGSS
jgi:signal transduction histidine kinase